MAPHSSTLAWKIPWTEKPGRLQSMGSLRVRHNWSDLVAAAAWTKHILISHPLVDGHLGLCHFLTVVSNAAINICAQIFAWTFFHFSLGYTPRCGILGAYGNSMFNFSRISEAVFHSDCSIIHSHQQCMKIRFLHFLANISYHLSFSFKSKCPQLLHHQLTGEVWGRAKLGVKRSSLNPQ